MALEVTAAGGHNLLMNGCGKSMLARVAGYFADKILRSVRKPWCAVAAGAFRAPHYQHGVNQISLAHNGVLFLDELPEFMLISIETGRLRALMCISAIRHAFSLSPP